MNIEDSWNVIDNTPKIRVAIRKRPLGRKELQRNDADIVDIRGVQTTVVRETKTKVDLTKYIEEHAFNFDRAFDETATNQHIYFETLRPLIGALFNKAKVTCFAYGQTGSGKTHTMMGDSTSSIEQNTCPGLYLLAAQDIFALLEQPNYKHLGVYVSFYEIYCSKLHDLLNERQLLHAREDAKQNVNIVGLSEKRIVDVQSLMQIIEFGNSVRTTASTSANLDSSRSHAILQITLKEGNKMFGKMSFIDLAGSERGADVVDTTKQTRMDGAEINKSLLALKECIRALDQDKKHTPFRGSKLTLVLKDSFTGNCKTLMIGNISPSSHACEHTLNTLRYADRVKELKKPAEEKQALSQVDLLAQQLMLPRLNKNSTKIAIRKDDDEEPAQEIPMPQTNKNKPTSSTAKPNPLYAANQLPYSNKLASQLLLNQQKQVNFPNQMNNYMNAQPPQNLFENTYDYQEPVNGNKLMKDVVNVNTPKKSQMQANLLNKLPINNYQPSLYQNVHSQLAGKNGKENIVQTEFQQNANAMYNNLVHNPVKEIEQMKIKNEEDLIMLNQRHQELINIILCEEEEVISTHRQHIDDIVDCVKQEMVLLNEVDKPASDIDEYVDSLDSILAHKMEMISMLRSRLIKFKGHLREEEALSKKFHEQKTEMMDIFDLNAPDDCKNDEMQLLDDLHQVMS